jgi:hypothetical protein
MHLSKTKRVTLTARHKDGAELTVVRTIDLDASNWKTIDDFYDALLPELGAPDWHGHNANALNDSVIWGGINAVNHLS